MSKASEYAKEIERQKAVRRPKYYNGCGVESLSAQVTETGDLQIVTTRIVNDLDALNFAAWIKETFE